MDRNGYCKSHEIQGPDLKKRSRVKKDSSKKGRLLERDKEILMYLARHGCASGQRIKEKFWDSSPGSRAHYRRLGVLKSKGLVENVLGDARRPLGYQITRKGTAVLRREFGFISLPIQRRSYRSQYDHDQTLLKIQDILEESPVVKDFKTESEVRSMLHKESNKFLNWEMIQKIPDALFHFRVHGHDSKIALELELSLKAKKRYAKIFRDHLLSKDWDFAFYIAKDDPMKRKLMAFLDEVSGKDMQVRVANEINGVYFSTLNQVLNERLHAPFTNGESTFSLAEIAQNFGL